MEKCYFSFKMFGMYFQLTKNNVFQIIKNTDGWKTAFKFTFWYIVFLKGLQVRMGRKFGYYKCNQFTLISLYLFHIRICPNKQNYINLQCAG